MQDIQNIPPPDVNSPEKDNDFGNHSDIRPDLDGENQRENFPLPSDQPPPVPIEEPGDDEKFLITEDNPEPRIIV